jgi:hypothetical protein
MKGNGRRKAKQGYASSVDAKKMGAYRSDDGNERDYTRQ